jgi:hypothetical protein
VWPPRPALIVTPLATGIVQFATEKERPQEAGPPAPSTHTDMHHLVPRAVVAASARHAAASEKSRLAVKADSVFESYQSVSLWEK